MSVIPGKESRENNIWCLDVHMDVSEDVEVTDSGEQKDAPLILALKAR